MNGNFSFQIPYTFHMESDANWASCITLTRIRAFNDGMKRPSISPIKEYGIQRNFLSNYISSITEYS